MKIGIFSDIHSNTEGLTRVLDALRAGGAESFVCLGDLVGYGAEPNEVVQMVRDLNCPVIMGNHDKALLDPKEREVFNPYARKAIEWTEEQISPENKDFIAGLPMQVSRDGILFIHASPFEPGQWHYLDNPSEYRKAFEHLGGHRACFVGHTHRPSIVVEDSKGHQYAHGGNSTLLVDGFRYLINDGSAGQSRDGLVEAGCALLDTDEDSVQLLRVSYEVEATRRKIRDAGLPAFLHERLAKGI